MDRERIARLISFDDDGADTSTGFVGMTEGRQLITDDKFCEILAEVGLEDMTSPVTPKTNVFYAYINSGGYINRSFHSYELEKLMTFLRERDTQFPPYLVIERVISPGNYAQVTIPLPEYRQNLFVKNFREYVRKTAGIWNREKDWQLDYEAGRRKPAKRFIAETYKEIYRWMLGFEKVLNDVR